MHADEGYRVGLEPAFQETIDPSAVDPTKHHVYVPGEAHAYRLYEAPRETTELETQKIVEARCYADKDIITPQWLKVSDTPWGAPARASGGYGRKIHDTSVSYRPGVNQSGHRRGRDGDESRRRRRGQGRG